jgi:hypothetical protein
MPFILPGISFFQFSLINPFKTMQTEKKHFALIRVPHQMPAELLFDYPLRESDEYSSFWDDANSVRIFDNDTELARYYQEIIGTNYKPHQHIRILSLIEKYFLNDYECLFCDECTNLPDYISMVSKMTIQERLFQTNQL